MYDGVVKMLDIKTPYFNRRIRLSKKSINDAKENIIFHLLPYIVARENPEKREDLSYFEKEVKQCKAMISFTLMDGILCNNVPNTEKRLQFKIKALKGGQLKQDYFDLYKIEYNHYINNNGDDTIINGLSYKDIQDRIREDALSLMIMYFFVFNLLRLAQYGKDDDYRIDNARRLTNSISFTINEDGSPIKVFSYDKIEKARSRYIKAAAIVFGYIHTLFKYDKLQFTHLDFNNEDNLKQIKSALSKLDDTEIYEKYDDIMGYILYAQKILTTKVCKHADKNEDWFVINKSDIRRYGFTESKPILPDFSESEQKIIKK